MRAWTVLMVALGLWGGLASPAFADSGDSADTADTGQTEPTDTGDPFVFDTSDTSSSTWVDGSTAGDLAKEKGGSPTGSCDSASLGSGSGLAGLLVLLAVGRRRA